jgi:hypothetical protein
LLSEADIEQYRQTCAISKAEWERVLCLRAEAEKLGHEVEGKQAVSERLEKELSHLTQYIEGRKVEAEGKQETSERLETEIKNKRTEYADWERKIKQAQQELSTLRQQAKEESKLEPVGPDGTQCGEAIQKKPLKHKKSTRFAINGSIGWLFLGLPLIGLGVFGIVYIFRIGFSGEDFIFLLLGLAVIFCGIILIIFRTIRNDEGLFWCWLFIDIGVFLIFLGIHFAIFPSEDYPWWTIFVLLPFGLLFFGMGVGTLDQHYKSQR